MRQSEQPAPWSLVLTLVVTCFFWALSCYEARLLRPCRDVLRCMDRSVDQDVCEELFPGCELDEPRARDTGDS